MGRWISWSRFLLSEYVSSGWRRVFFFSILRSLYISGSLIKAINMCLTKSYSAVSNWQLAPNAVRRQRKFSNLSPTFFLHINSRNISFVVCRQGIVYIGRLNLLLNGQKRCCLIPCSSVPMHNYIWLLTLRSALLHGRPSTRILLNGSLRV